MSGREGREFGSKVGSAGVASQQNEDIQRKERLRQLALETIDLSKDPYFRKNHHGTFDCTLCLTVHNDEGNYLTHTQGKRHQSNLARRAFREAKAMPTTFLAVQAASKYKAPVRRTVKIGRPGYRVTKQYDAETRGKSLLFQIEYPEIEEGCQPRHRFMSAFEQRKEPPDRSWQLILFAAEPYETISFKIPNLPIFRETGELFFTHWDVDHKIFSLQLVFKPDETPGATTAPAASSANGIPVATK